MVLCATYLHSVVYQPPSSFCILKKVAFFAVVFFLQQQLLTHIRTYTQTENTSIYVLVYCKKVNKQRRNLSFPHTKKRFFTPSDYMGKRVLLPFSKDIFFALPRPPKKIPSGPKASSSSLSRADWSDQPWSLGQRIFFSGLLEWPPNPFINLEPPHFSLQVSARFSPFLRKNERIC